MRKHSDKKNKLNLKRYINKNSDILEKLQESENNFRSLFETINEMIFVGALDGKIIYTNSSVSEKLGFSEEELQKMYILDVHPDEYKKQAEIILSKMLNKELSICPIPLRKKDNRLLPVETRIWLGKWDNKDVIYGLSKDLSLVQVEHDKFQKFFESNPCPMVITESGSKKIMQVNEAFTEIIGYEKSEVIGKASRELELFIDYYNKEELEKQLASGGNFKNIEIKVSTKNKVLIGMFSGESLDYMGKQFFLTVMTDYISKPIDINKLKLLVLCKYVNKQLRIKKLIGEKTVLRFQYIVSRLIKELNFTKETAEGLIIDFINTISESLEELRNAVYAKDYSELAKVSHSIKGVAGNIRIPELADICFELEKNAKLENFELCNVMIKEINNIYLKLHRDIYKL